MFYSENVPKVMWILILFYIVEVKSTNTTEITNGELTALQQAGYNSNSAACENWGKSKTLTLLDKAYYNVEFWLREPTFHRDPFT